MLQDVNMAQTLIIAVPRAVKTHILHQYKNTKQRKRVAEKNKQI